MQQKPPQTYVHQLITLPHNSLSMNLRKSYFLEMQELLTNIVYLPYNETNAPLIIANCQICVILLNSLDFPSKLISHHTSLHIDLHTKLRIKSK